MSKAPVANANQTTHLVRVVGDKSFLGSSNFAEIITKNWLYADKSLLIKDLIDYSSKVTLITRPRRWGKTLNMSMLQHFFSPNVYDLKTHGLFDTLLISQIDDGKYMEHQGKYPVIFISFKDVKDQSLQDSIKNINLLINELYKVHDVLLSSEKISNTDKEKYIKYSSDSNLGQKDVEQSILFLSKLLKEHHNQKVYILIDEYDTPLNEAYNKPHFDELVTFLKNFLSNALKDNAFLEKGVLTGILRISKDSMLSGLNNLQTYTILNKKYKQHFGFTDSELDLLFKNEGLERDENAVKAWYNGYLIDGTTLYNPWSIMNCIVNEGELRPYWVNTGNEAILKEVLQNSSIETKNALQQLILGHNVIQSISETVRYGDFITNQNALWSLLFFTGHLTATAVEISNTNYDCSLKIPNKEIQALYNDIFITWMGEDLNYSRYVPLMLEKLISGKIADFAKDMSNLLIRVASFRDYANQPEAFYHGFMLALSTSLINQYYIESNRESGLGYPDLIFIPKENKQQQRAVILEFKHVSNKSRSAADATTTNNNSSIAKQIAEEALNQINIKAYQATLSQHDYIKEVIKIGLAFDGKNVEFAYMIEPL